MSDVRRLGSRNNLGNVPHMLRNLAAELESGAEPMPRTLLLVAIGDGNAPPGVFQFGGELSRLEEAGALAACMQQILGTEPA